MGLTAIRQATPADAPTVSAILREAADWLTERGMPMWRASELQPGRIANDVAEGLFHLAEVEGEPAGTIKFQLVDPEFWPEIPAGECAFVHRLAVRRRFAGLGVSRAMLDWAAARAAALGLSHLRLDCEASRQKLRDFYEGAGFRHQRNTQVGPYFVALYELDVRRPG